MSKVTATEAQKIMAILEEMTIKLSFLDNLKAGSNAPQINEMMGDEINRVMKQQKDLENTYAKLIAYRGDLKGLSNKRKLQEIQNEIIDVAKSLKESTKQLCRVLKDNPDVAGNLAKIKNDKAELNLTIEKLIAELRDFSFENFKNVVSFSSYEQGQLNRLKTKEKELTQEIKDINANFKKAQTDYARETNEANQEIIALKKQVNEAKIECDLTIKYREKEIAGKQNCQLRLYEEEEKNLQDKIDQLKEQKRVETTVSMKIKEHLTKKIEDLNRRNDEWELNRVDETKKLDDDIQAITEKRELTKAKLQENNDRVNMEHVEQNEREKRELDRNEEMEKKRNQKIRMEEAAKFIQAKWAGYKVIRATMGKKKKKKGKKKKGKKKK